MAAHFLTEGGDQDGCDPFLESRCGVTNCGFERLQEAHDAFDLALEVVQDFTDVAGDLSQDVVGFASEDALQCVCDTVDGRQSVQQTADGVLRLLHVAGECVGLLRDVRSRIRQRRDALAEVEKSRVDLADLRNVLNGHSGFHCGQLALEDRHALGEIAPLRGRQPHHRRITRWPHRRPGTNGNYEERQYQRPPERREHHTRART
ncbi:hypothetical protein ACRCUN_08905 [Mycobacterium sp. LTG2003]